MTCPLYIVLARVVGRDQALEKWRERLVSLCAVSKTEPYSNSYYWGQDLDGEPDTLWGLEAYYHPYGFFVGHVSTSTFKEEMRKVDEDKLLRTVQGLASPDYDLHHYDFYAGFLKRRGDSDADSEDSFVVIVHFWAHPGRRGQLLGALADYTERVKSSKAKPIAVQSFAVLKEVNDVSLATTYIRTKTEAQWQELQASVAYKELLAGVQALTVKQETHRSRIFIGHIDQEPSTSFV